jgi:hypothetical protein
MLISVRSPRLARALFVRESSGDEWGGCAWRAIGCDGNGLACVLQRNERCASLS